MFEDVPYKEMVVAITRLIKRASRGEKKDNFVQVWLNCMKENDKPMWDALVKLGKPHKDKDFIEFAYSAVCMWTIQYLIRLRGEKRAQLEEVLMRMTLADIPDEE